MNAEQAKQVSESALDHLMAALEQGHSDALKQYLEVMSRFHRYSWGNCLLIYSQRPCATHVAGFRAWLRLGRQVRKGEKGIVILAPMVCRKKADDHSTEDQESRVLGFRAAYVFDVNQTDGEPLPKFAAVHGDPQGHADRLKAFVAAKGIELEYSADIAPALGVSSGGKITLMPNLTPAEAFSTLAHEVAHELLHRGDRRAETTHVVRETEAEAVAFVVASAIGLDADTASADYIQLHRGDKETPAESLALIQRTAAELVIAVTQQPDPQE
jgi:antirestriction protein ArdC